MDDIEHYGNGLSDLPAVLNSLKQGSRATGVGFAWSKFAAYALDWDAALPALNNPLVDAEGAAVQSWDRDIWSGGFCRFTLPRSLGNQPDKHRRTLLLRTLPHGSQQPACALPPSTAPGTKLWQWCNGL